MKVLMLLMLGVVATIAIPVDVLEEFSVGNHQFTADVYRELLKTQNGNILVSPVSAEVILALTHAGAKGETATQLSSGLHLPESSENIHKIFSALSDHIKGDKFYTLKSANKVYVKHDFSIKPEFKEVAVNVFNAEIQNVDFSKASEAVSEINNWVSEKTDDNIKNLLVPTDINEGTRSVLVNALFFEAKWRKNFEEYHTKSKPFYVNANDHVNVDMMATTGGYNYYESPELDAKVLEMPYTGEDISMTIVLPNDREGLSHVEKNIEKAFETPEYTSKTVEVELPKFKVEVTIPFIPILQGLGVKNAFAGNADFSGLADGNLKIDKVVQKNFIEVHERGTRAASATAVVIGLGSALPPPIQAHFVADHPFFYYIKKGDVVLFAGSVKKF